MTMTMMDQAATPSPTPLKERLAPALERLDRTLKPLGLGCGVRERESRMARCERLEPFQQLPLRPLAEALDLPDSSLHARRAKLFDARDAERLVEHPGSLQREPLDPRELESPRRKTAPQRLEERASAGPVDLDNLRGERFSDSWNFLEPALEEKLAEVPAEAFHGIRTRQIGPGPVAAFAQQAQVLADLA